MRLKDARKASGLTQIDLAKQVGVTQTLVSFWEAGTSAPSDRHKEIMDRILTQKVDWTAEFEPLDLFEQRAAFKYALYVSEQVSSDAAARLVFNNDKPGLRKLLKQTGYLPRDYRPATAEILLPPGMKGGDEK